jgi:mannose-6-phosphate isomerase
MRRGTDRVSAIRLASRAVEKPWGRSDLPAGLAASAPGARVGEIWFEDPRGGPPAQLLVKYLFTSERLSVQVHPDEERARANGATGGKDEAWLILDAEPSARIGLGLGAQVDKRQLRSAALDGSIEELLEWRPAVAGDFYFLEAGTIHALGAGVSLIEIQQNSDTTYRLYDFGRPRDLHVDQAVAAARLDPAPSPTGTDLRRAGRTILAQGGTFVVELWSGACSATLAAGDDDQLWIVPFAGEAVVNDTAMRPGGVWLSEGPAALTLGARSAALVAYPGASLRDVAE